MRDDRRRVSGRGAIGEGASVHAVRRRARGDRPRLAAGHARLRAHRRGDGHDVFADAEACDVFTFHAAHDVLSPALSAAVVRDAAVTHLPGLRQRGHDPGRWRMLLPYMPRWFAGLDLDGYDVVVCSSHAFAVAARPRRPGALHACYCYTPIRYVWQRAIDGASGWTGAQARVWRALVGRMRRPPTCARRRGRRLHRDLDRRRRAHPQRLRTRRGGRSPAGRGRRVRPARRRARPAITSPGCTA